MAKDSVVKSIVQDSCVIVGSRSRNFVWKFCRGLNSTVNDAFCDGSTYTQLHADTVLDGFTLHLQERLHRRCVRHVLRVKKSLIQRTKPSSFNCRQYIPSRRSSIVGSLFSFHLLCVPTVLPLAFGSSEAYFCLSNWIRHPPSSGVASSLSLLWWVVVLQFSNAISFLPGVSGSMDC